MGLSGPLLNNPNPSVGFGVPKLLVYIPSLLAAVAKSTDFCHRFLYLTWNTCGL